MKTKVRREQSHDSDYELTSVSQPSRWEKVRGKHPVLVAIGAGALVASAVFVTYEATKKNSPESSTTDSEVAAQWKAQGYIPVRNAIVQFTEVDVLNSPKQTYDQIGSGTPTSDNVVQHVGKKPFVMYKPVEYTNPKNDHLYMGASVNGSTADIDWVDYTAAIHQEVVQGYDTVTVNGWVGEQPYVRAVVKKGLFYQQGTNQPAGEIVTLKHNK